MLPVFKEYRTMLYSFGIDLSEYDEDKLWIDNQIIKGFDKQGKERKILRLKVNDNLEYEYKYYTKETKKNGVKIIKPKNEELESWEETYLRLESQILEKEKESLRLLEKLVLKYYKIGYKIVLPTSMGKDSKLVEFLYDKCLGIPKDVVFNNTTLDCSDVYKEVKSKKYIKIINPFDKNGNPLSFYNMVKNLNTTPTRVNRYCCTIFKEKPTEDYYNNIKHVLYIYGIRNEESLKRSNYSDIMQNYNWKKIHNEWYGLLPIRKWEELELWLYTIHNNISINPKYKKGYMRVGCHVACPYYSKSTWVLDKYWYPYQYNRWHEYLKNDFLNGEKWIRMNCTEKEYHLKWNGGVVRNTPNNEVIEEFMKYKGFTDKKLAEQYFEKKCMMCSKKVRHKNEVAMNLKLNGRNLKNDKFLCKKCLCKQFGWDKKRWDDEVSYFKESGCELF